MDAARRKLARPHLVRAAIAGLIWVVTLVASAEYPRVRFKDGIDGDERFTLIAAVVLLVTGIMAVRALSSAAGKVSRERLGTARGGVLGYTIQVIGYFVVLSTVVAKLGASLSGLLVGGALTGIIIGIAAQQTLGNFIAGIVLLIVRPFSIGEVVVLKSGPLGGEYEGTVTEMTFFYTHIATERGPVQLPNAGVLASAIGPGARSATNGDEDEPQTPSPSG